MEKTLSNKQKTLYSIQQTLSALFIGNFNVVRAEHADERLHHIRQFADRAFAQQMSLSVECHLVRQIQNEHGACPVVFFHYVLCHGMR